MKVSVVIPTYNRGAVVKDAYLAGPPEPPSVDAIEIDLAEGLATAVRRLDEERPGAARLRYRDVIVGALPAAAGAERLRGIHLREALSGPLSWEFVRAVAVTPDSRLTVTSAPMAAA